MPRAANVLQQSELEGLRAPLVDADFLTGCRVCRQAHRLSDAPHLDLGPDGSVYLCPNGCAPLLLITRPGSRIPDSGLRLGAWVIRNPETLLFRPPSSEGVVKVPALHSALHPWLYRGYHLAPIGPRPVPTVEETLDDIGREVRGILGSVYDRIAAADDRALRSPTPPRRHRLMELMDGARRTLDSQRHTEPVIVADVVELDLLRHLIAFWKDAPALPGILAALEDPDAYRHTVVTLAAARLLREVGNAIHLEVEGGPARTPDLRVATGPSDVAVECKAPRQLQRPRRELTQDRAGRLVRRAMKKAGTGPGDQLAPDRPGLLVVGGNQLTRPTMARLREGAEAALIRSSASKHIVAIGVVSIGILLSEEPGEGQRSLASVLSLEVAENPEYAGTVRLETERVAWGPRPLRQPTTEIRLEGRSEADLDQDP